MAGYSTSAPPQKVSGGGLDGTLPSLWFYSSVDNATTVDVPGYFTNARDLGMKAGDYIWVADSDASPIITTTHRVVSIDATTGAATITTGDTTNTGTTGT